ncbi:MAG: ketopantoate reductase family protein [Lachnospiraceae bacterium]|nr:ketopantoate reductase family protein [Lacrimispora saccharolytica]MDD7436439.1 ketopantoate reductase family protein [Lachnospiraceae bacterium]RGD63480.1 ketopantoate reductase family protein [Lachnospiraceae bacterium OF09-6]
MKIVVIGAGAMGSIYGGHLSQNNEVYIVDTNQSVVDAINANGLQIDENGVTNTYHPTAVTSTEGITDVDLVILFVKAIFSKVALEGNKNIIGEHTHLLTLQNGAGHEHLLMEYVPKERVVIGTTEDNGAVLGMGHVRRGGVGKTNAGMLVEDKEGFLAKMKESFDSCGFTLNVCDTIQQLIWDKLFTNVSLSAVTGILQVDMGYIAANPYAWNLTCKLIHEAVEVAHAMGLKADEEEIVKKVKETSVNNPNGCTSIRADLRVPRKTEVDTISGAVVRAAKEVGVEVPCHEFVVNMVHAMEGKDKE